MAVAIVLRSGVLAATASLAGRLKRVSVVLLLAALAGVGNRLNSFARRLTGRVIYFARPVFYGCGSLKKVGQRANQVSIIITFYNALHNPLSTNTTAKHISSNSS